MYPQSGETYLLSVLVWETFLLVYLLFCRFDKIAALIKILLWPKAARREDSFGLCVTTHYLVRPTCSSQDRNSRQDLEAVIIEKHCLLTYSTEFLYSPSPRTQRWYCPQQTRKYPHRHTQKSIWRTFLSWYYPFPVGNLDRPEHTYTPSLWPREYQGTEIRKNVRTWRFRKRMSDRPYTTIAILSI